MSKNGKTFLIVIVVVLLALGIIWAVYENYKTEPANVNATTDLPDENKGIDNIINDFVENALTNEEVGTNVLEDSENTQKTETDENDSSNSSDYKNSEEESNGNSSEVVEGTTTSRQEKAIKLAKEYYEEEYGSSDDIYFRYDGVNGEGKHIVVASSNAVTVAFLIVDLNTGLVTEK